MKGLFIAGAMIAATLIGVSAFAIAAPFSPTVRNVERQYTSPALIPVDVGTSVRVASNGALVIDGVRRLRRGATLAVRDCGGIRLQMTGRTARWTLERGTLRIRVLGADALDGDCIEVVRAIGVYR